MMGHVPVPGEVVTHCNHPENKYLVLHQARDHHSDTPLVVYVPLYDDPSFEGTARISVRTMVDFMSKFQEEE